jgi:RNA-directed DNA polymerase
MTALTKAGALSHKVDWHTIDWQKAHQNVRRLQVRIVKAVKEGRWGKVKALQRLLTRSFSAKALAVKRVTENRGKKTPGVDRQTWNSPEKKAKAISEMRQYGYRSLPLRRIYIPKSNGKMRPLSIPVMADRAMQALYLMALDPIAETIADPNSYGFRSERSAIDAITQLHLLLCKNGSPEWILEGDIQNCFGTLDHQWMMDNIVIEKTILQKWLKAGFIDRHIFYETLEGAPQGAICSPVLAHMTLNGLERKLKQVFQRNSAKGRKAKVNVIVYADDFIITGSSKQLLEEEVKPLVREFLRERGLKLSTEKTKITHIRDGIDFLGQNARKYKNRVFMKPSRKNVKSFLEKVRAIIKGNKQATAEQLINKLNPVIRGWANYHRHSASYETFRKVDHAIYKALRQWAKRRHPDKPTKWIWKKYFCNIDGHRAAFYAKITDKDRKATRLLLFWASNMSFKRHIKIKGEANPYDPAWETYFEERIGLQMLEDLKERKRLLRLWFSQDGICPVCSQKITKMSGWNIHHIIRRTDGGKETMNNLVLLHPNCHRQVHSQGLEVSKPRLMKKALGEA